MAVYLMSLAEGGQAPAYEQFDLMDCSDNRDQSVVDAQFDSLRENWVWVLLREHSLDLYILQAFKLGVN